MIIDLGPVMLRASMNAKDLIQHKKHSVAPLKLSRVSQMITDQCTDDDRRPSPRGLFDHESEQMTNAQQLMKPVDRMALHHCKNCSTAYYCLYSADSCGEFCNKDCKACYSFLTGRKL